MNTKQTELKEQVIQAGLRLAKKKGLLNVTVKDVCDACGLPLGSFKGRTGLKHNEFIRVLKERGAPTGESCDYVKAHPDVRREQFIAAACKIARSKGFFGVSNKDIARECGVSPGAVQNLFARMNDVRKAMADYAIKTADIPVIASARLAGYITPSALTDDIRDQLKAYVAGE